MNEFKTEEEIKQEENPHDPLESLRYIAEEIKRRKKLKKLVE